MNKLCIDPKLGCKYFNPKRPSVIFIHGWSIHFSKRMNKTTFNPKINYPRWYFVKDENTADYWIKKGWNIGIFRWHSFADEISVKKKEKRKMRKEIFFKILHSVLTSPFVFLYILGHHTDPYFFFLMFFPPRLFF